MVLGIMGWELVVGIKGRDMGCRSNLSTNVQLK